MNKRELEKLYKAMKAASLEAQEAMHTRFSAEANETAAKMRHEDAKDKLLGALREIRQPLVIDGKVLSVGRDGEKLCLKIETAKII